MIKNILLRCNKSNMLKRNLFLFNYLESYERISLKKFLSC